ncbi:hypothetical protein NST12_16965 [Bacillus sp. FSL W8-1127]|uniref:hypothetical protein n=1 Tax=Bacillus sp. FSL W8-1127 TaxID=2954710 RepID=UPI0030FB6245
MNFLFKNHEGMGSMKIGEILELTQTERLSDIAKERLTIGEKAARQALKAAGCYSISGKRGWHCDNPNILDQSIYDFVERKVKNDIKKAQMEVSATVESNTILKQSEKTENKQINKKSNQFENKPTKKVTYEIEEDLHDQLKIKAIMEKRKVSEIVNEILKNALS